LKLNFFFRFSQKYLTKSYEITKKFGKYLSKFSQKFSQIVACKNTGYSRAQKSKDRTTRAGQPVQDS
jgi:hypothetical protein